jgi:hypothetical protein
MKKILIPGLVAGLVMLVAAMVVGWLTTLVLPSMAQEYGNASLYRTWSDPIVYVYFVYPFFLGIALAWVWNTTKGVIGKGSLWVKGSRFARAFWLVSALPGILMTYSTFPISLAVALSWLLSSLVQLVCAGFVYAKMNK